MKLVRHAGLVIIGTAMALFIWYGQPVLARALESAGYVAGCGSEGISEEQPVNGDDAQAVSQNAGNVRNDGPESPGDSEPAEALVPQAAWEAVSRAKEDAAERQGLVVADIRVTLVQRVEWRDSSLGCPKPGAMYMQVITPGYRVLLPVPRPANLAPTVHGRQIPGRRPRAFGHRRAR